MKEVSKKRNGEEYYEKVSSTPTVILAIISGTLFIVFCVVMVLTISHYQKQEIKSQNLIEKLQAENKELKGMLATLYSENEDLKSQLAQKPQIVRYRNRTETNTTNTTTPIEISQPEKENWIMPLVKAKIKAAFQEE